MGPNIPPNHNPGPRSSVTRCVICNVTKSLLQLLLLKLMCSVKRDAPSLSYPAPWPCGSLLGSPLYPATRPCGSTSSNTLD